MFDQGEERAVNGRWLIPKLATFFAAAYVVHYYFKYNLGVSVSHCSNYCTVLILYNALRHTHREISDIEMPCNTYVAHRLTALTQI